MNAINQSQYNMEGRQIGTKLIEVAPICRVGIQVLILTPLVTPQ
jgi:hypothetical protein